MAALTRSSTSVSSIGSASPTMPTRHSTISPSLRKRDSSATLSTKPFSHSIFDRHAGIAAARATYLKMLFGGAFMVIILIFTVFSIYWGSLWKTPAHNLPGWIVDFDGGLIGQAITTNLPSHGGKISWTVVSADRFPEGISQLANAVVEDETWVAVSINSNASAHLSAALSSPNITYSGFETITAMAVEARNENAYRSIIRTSLQTSLDALTRQISIQIVHQLTSNPNANVTALMEVSPQTLVAPVGYTIQNLRPFDIPVATAVTFVGLLYQLILAFFIVMIGNAARTLSGFDTLLTTRSLVVLRLGTSFIAYLILSLFYCLLSVAFQLDLTRKFGHGGFMVFWMLNYCGMLTVGLALEAMITLLTPNFIPFFMLTWAIVNVSVSIFPLEVMPKIYHYGYAAPFYNVSSAMRTIVFGTKNRVGFNFAILIVWIVISCVTIPLIQIFVRRRAMKQIQEEDLTLEVVDTEMTVEKEGA
ncbi:hypothetical protein BDQ12DRAFT_685318 [Crucibulum laeve]|uniref:DUF3533 domain-containing protein n=1 Tax=Crucibulum laeve TaxID=68775 RepID=A0A5C3LYF8_9AGAR|nr:hypothetical protein BDQ12DRAFT_685318 [Crucibulum laeve]